MDELEKYKDYYENSPVMFVSVSPETGKIIDCNKTLVEHLDFKTKDDLIGKTLDELYHPESHVDYKRAFGVFKKEGKVENFKLTLRKSDGSKLPVLLNVTAVRDESGKILRSRSSFTDLSHSAELEKQNDILKFITEETNDGWWDWRIKENYEYMSPTLWKTLGYDPATKKHDPEEWQKIILPEDKEAAFEHFAKHVETRGAHPYYLQVRYRNGRGGITTVICRGRVVEWGENGEPLRMVGVHSDITKLKETEASLVRSNKELEQFAYVVSHDLQAPLRHITSYVSLLVEKLSGQLDDEGQRWVKYVTDGVARMKALINDLLAYSRVGNQHKEQVQEVDLSQVLGEVQSTLEVSIKEKAAKLEIEPLPSLRANPTQMRQLFQNLVENALKFGREGVPPVVSVSSKDLGGFWEFIVKDNGIGMEMEHADRIFQIFQRLHGKKDYEGTGIGLALCRKIVGLHGGSIRVSSIPREGSEFIFTLEK